MAASSPTAALEPARPASPLKALSFWGAGARPKPPPAFPAKMSKLRASTTAPGAIVRKYQSPAMVNAGLPGTNLAAGKGGGAGGSGHDPVSRAHCNAPRVAVRSRDPEAPGNHTMRWAPALHRIVEATLRCVRGPRVPLLPAVYPLGGTGPGTSPWAIVHVRLQPQVRDN